MRNRLRRRGLALAMWVKSSTSPRPQAAKSRNPTCGESLKEPALGMKSGRTCISRAAHSDWASLRDSAASATGARSAQLVRWVDPHLTAADEYHVLIAGMERISVDLGQFVVTGEPVAVLGGGTNGPLPKRAVQTTAYLYVSKDGIQVDPGPWWAVTESQEVRG